MVLVIISGFISYLMVCTAGALNKDSQLWFPDAHNRCGPFKYRSIYPTPTTTPFCASASETRQHASSGPLLTGFSIKNAQLGNVSTSCSSRSRPGSSVPRAKGGAPTMATRGVCAGGIPAAASATEGNIRQSIHAAFEGEASLS